MCDVCDTSELQRGAAGLCLCAIVHARALFVWWCAGYRSHTRHTHIYMLTYNTYIYIYVYMYMCEEKKTTNTYASALPCRRRLRGRRGEKGAVSTTTTTYIQHILHTTHYIIIIIIYIQFL
jgi:hypothetical protein